MDSNKQRGLYTPEDMLWRINRETLLILGGVRAVLLEVAHPLIAAGVARHSDYQKRPLKRLMNTVRVMQKLSFGDMDAAKEAARHVHMKHRPVTGELGEQIGPFAPDVIYNARDTGLGLWVFATLIDSILLAYEQFVSPLTDEEKAAYYEDSKRMAHMLGVPPKHMPPAYEDFEAYMDEMIHSEALAVGDIGREVAQGLFAHPIIGPVAKLGSLPGIGLMPPHLREAFSFEWGAGKDRWLKRISGTTRWLRTHLPGFLFVHPPALLGEARYRLHQRRRRGEGRQASGRA